MGERHQAVRQARGRLWRGLGIALVFALLAGVAEALIPSADRVARAFGQANVKAGRSQALKLDVVMRIGGGEPVATGELVTDVPGLARLELRTDEGVIERHVLQGMQHYASRNGVELESPREFLPPLFWLQADSAVTVQAAVSAFGLRYEAVAMAPCDEADCFVIGDPRLAPPPLPEAFQGVSLGELPPEDLPDAYVRDGKYVDPNAPPEEEGAAGESADGSLDAGFGADFDADDEGYGEPGDAAADGEIEEALPADAVVPTLWIDSSSFEVRRLRWSDSARAVMGPQARFGKLLLPAWIEIQEGQHLPVRLEIKRVTPVSAPVAAFSREWLFSPTGIESSPADAASAGWLVTPLDGVPPAVATEPYE